MRCALVHFVKEDRYQGRIKRLKTADSKRQMKATHTAHCSKTRLAYLKLFIVPVQEEILKITFKKLNLAAKLMAHTIPAFFGTLDK